MIRALLLLICALTFAEPALAQRLDETPRTAVISAFGPEMTALKAATADRRDYVQAGATFTTGVLEGKPVVLFLSGMSMVNAAMTTQAALDRFKVTRVVFSGIAGGVDPALDVGDVVVAEQWGQYLENALAREVAPGKFEPPQGELLAAEKLPPFGMMYPRGVVVTRAPGQIERRVWFPADPAMLATAREVAGKVKLKRCAAQRCLAKEPRVVVAEQWGQYLENALAREVAPGKFEPPQGELLATEKLTPFGMMYPRGVVVTRAPGQIERRVWVPADPAMLATAREVAGKVTLKRCAAERCLAKEPRVVVGGNGVSGQSVVDNAAVRTWAYGAFGAKVLDMESAAVAQVAYVNGTPFIAFRSLSDLAGGDPGKNQALTFFQLASDNSAVVVRAFLAALP